MGNLETIAGKICADFEAKNKVRDETLQLSRELIRHCARAIRATHRGEFEQATELLATAKTLASTMVERVADYADLYYAGYTQDALKEFAEASITYALITDHPLPGPDELGVEYAAYLNGLGETTGELRRHVLDLIRRGELERGEEILSMMDDIYGVLITIDLPEAVTGGLRHTTDMVRGVLERTRGDLTLSLQQEKLQRALREFEERVSGERQRPDHPGQ